MTESFMVLCSEEWILSYRMIQDIQKQLLVTPSASLKTFTGDPIQNFIQLPRNLVFCVCVSGSRVASDGEGKMCAILFMVSVVTVASPWDSGSVVVYR
jgi:hypothetical protein